MSTLTLTQSTAKARLLKQKRGSKERVGGFGSSINYILENLSFIQLSSLPLAIKELERIPLCIQNYDSTVGFVGKNFSLFLYLRLLDLGVDTINLVEIGVQKQNSHSSHLFPPLIS